MAEIFTWAPDTGSAGQTAIDQTVSKFGDGYTQVVLNGLHPESQTWPVTFSGSKAYVVAIRDFLRRNMGKKIQWTAPLDDAPRLWRFEGWSPLPQEGDNYRISTTFIEDNSP